MLLGLGEPHGVLIAVLTVCLIVYQLIRYVMTIQISALREAEERSGISPPRDVFWSYVWLYWVHRGLNASLWLVYAVFGYRLYVFLFTDLVLIGNG
jgi:hypothetical protein